MSIPASAIVAVTPSVLSAGGTALDINGLFLTTAARVPVGQVIPFASPDAVAAYFGGASAEAQFAATYFAGYDTSTVKPGAMLFTQYPQAAVAGWVRGGSGLTLAQVQAIIAGTLSVTADGGAAKVSSALNLSTATSFSDAATKIQAAFTSPGFTVAYDSVAGAFLITSSTTGATSSIVVASGTVAAALRLTSATGAVTSPGAIAAVPGTFMTALTNATQNWVAFTSVFEPSDADCLAFAAWTNGRNRRYLYGCWDTSAAPTVANDTSSIGYQIKQLAYDGTALLYQGVNDIAVNNMGALLLGMIASVDFSAANGRATMAFKSQPGFPANVSDLSTAANLLASGYNFYGTYATANDNFIFLNPGSISGTFLWIDSYINQVWLNAGLQLAAMSLLTSVGSIPFNQDGYALVEAALFDPISQAIDFGAIRAGVTLSAAQAQQVVNSASLAAVAAIQLRGWYLQISDATPQVRAARGPITPKLWYTDGQSIQSISLASIEIQ